MAVKKKKKKLPPRKPVSKKRKKLPPRKPVSPKRKKFSKKLPSKKKPAHIKSSKKLPTKSNKKKTVTKKKKKPFYIYINDVKVTEKLGLRKDFSVVNIINYTKVRALSAIIRQNGERIYLKTKLKIRSGDIFEIKEYRKTRKKKPTSHVKPPAPRDIPKKVHERPDPVFILNVIRGVEARKKRLKEAAKQARLEAFEDLPGEWVNGIPEEFRTHDGRTASWVSYVRSDPKSEEWYQQMVYLRNTFGEDSAQLQEYMDDIASETGRPINEVFTLLMSH
jgi:hypothetical protein